MSLAVVMEPSEKIDVILLPYISQDLLALVVARDWTNKFALRLHDLQRSLLRKALSFAKQNGIVVYSTCSLNPMEDESVVAAVLREFGAQIELLDIHNKLPGLKASRGVSDCKT